MDPNRTIEIILNSLLAGGGLAGVIAAVTAYKSRKRGEPGNETVAIRSAEPGWAELNDYWHNEVLAKNKEIERVRRSGEQRAAADAAYIDELEAHIWRQLPPPPPPRKEQK